MILAEIHEENPVLKDKGLTNKRKRAKTNEK